MKVGFDQFFNKFCAWWVMNHKRSSFLKLLLILFCMYLAANKSSQSKATFAYLKNSSRCNLIFELIEICSLTQKKHLEIYATEINQRDQSQSAIEITILHHLLIWKIRVSTHKEFTKKKTTNGTCNSAPPE